MPATQHLGGGGKGFSIIVSRPAWNTETLPQINHTNNLVMQNVHIVLGSGPAREWGWLLPSPLQPKHKEAEINQTYVLHLYSATSSIHKNFSHSSLESCSPLLQISYLEHWLSLISSLFMLHKILLQRPQSQVSKIERPSPVKQ